MNYFTLATTTMILGALSPLGASAQDEPPVTNEQYNDIKRELEEMKTTLLSLTFDQSVQSHPAGAGPQDGSDRQDDAAELRREMQRTNIRLDDLERLTLALDPGETGIHVTGYGFTLLNAPDEGDTTFTAAVVPLILWQINDSLLFETELEFEIGAGHGGTETEVELEYADLQFLVNDYLTFGVGKFLTPFGLFSERLHPAWINKLPNAPMVRGHDGLAPFTSIGAFARGVIPAGDQRINYALYFVNGPALIDAEEDPDEFGFLDFEEINDNKAFGGRLGYLPVPQLELGYSFIYGESDSENGLEAKSFVMGFDASYVVDTKPGLFDFRFEYVHSSVDDVTFDADGTLGIGPSRFSNDRDGLYAQAAFRPIHAGSEFFKNIEFVGRYDYMSLPDEVHEGGDRQRWTFGVNYWFNPSTVLKVSIDDTDFDGEESEQNFRIMLAVGF